MRKIFKFIDDIVWFLKWRFVPHHQYNKIHLPTKPGYYDQDERLIMAVFQMNREYLNELRAMFDTKELFMEFVESSKEDKLRLDADNFFFIEKGKLEDQAEEITSNMEGSGEYIKEKLGFDYTENDREKIVEKYEFENKIRKIQMKHMMNIIKHVDSMWV